MTRGATGRQIKRAVRTRFVGRLLPAACLVLVGCSGVTQTPFQRTAIEAAGTLAAAAETLTAVQEGRLTEGYARASFVSFAEAVRGVDARLHSEEGAPRTTEHLGRELHDVDLILQAPCLQGGCDAAAQIRQLKAASEDLLQASES
jgi:hypothetical protein